MTCKMCLKRGKPWKGSDPRCYFDNNEGDNWNCATIQALRNLVFTGGMFQTGRKKLPYGCQIQTHDDSSHATILISDIRLEDNWMGRCLYLEWYKDRGKTDTVQIMDGNEVPRCPSEEELLAIIKYYKDQGAYKELPLLGDIWI